jgi:hypothetical protein
VCDLSTHLVRQRNPRIGLAVVEVEEGDPGNASAGTEPDVAPGYSHLATPKRSCVAVAARRGRLRDHVVAACWSTTCRSLSSSGRTSTTGAMTV